MSSIQGHAVANIKGLRMEGNFDLFSESSETERGGLCQLAYHIDMCRVWLKKRIHAPQKMSITECILKLLILYPVLSSFSGKSFDEDLNIVCDLFYWLFICSIVQWFKRGTILLSHCCSRLFSYGWLPATSELSVSALCCIKSRTTVRTLSSTFMWQTGLVHII